MFRSVLLALVLSLFVAHPALAQDAPAAAANDTEVVLSVDGFKCDQCAAKLQRSLSELEGVASIDTDKWADGLVTVRLVADAEIEDAQFEKTVKKAGFVLKEVRRADRAITFAH
jgi:copper chaperone CopZ